VVAVLAALAADNAVEPEVVLKALDHHGIDAEAATPWAG